MTSKLTKWLYPIWAALIATPLLAAAPAWATETLTFIHTDVAGSPVAATDIKGNVVWREGYRPYGERTRNQAAAANNRQFFHGKAFDADTGLSYFGARHYDPLVGRFMGVDPQGFDEKNLHSFNRYVYGNNNPYKFIDPDGRAGHALLLLISIGYVGYELSPLSMPIMTAGNDAIVSTIGPGDVLGAVAGIRALTKVAAEKAGEGISKATDSISRAVSGETKYTAAGRQAHAVEPLPSGFERDVRIPGTRKRMDAYNKDSREIIEIKPNNSQAIRRGEKQLQRYCDLCDKNIGPGHSPKPIQTYDPKKYLE